MIKRKSSRFLIFLRLFIFNIIGFSAINAVILILRSLTNITLFENYELYSFSALILTSLIFALTNLSRFVCITKAIRTDDKMSDYNRLIEAIDKMKYRVTLEEQGEIICKSKYMRGLLDESIIIRLTDMELYINGTREALNRLIAGSQLKYEAYEIRAVNIQS